MIRFSHIALASLPAACSLVSAIALAQQSKAPAPLTRAQVRAEIAEWRQAGYDPFEWLRYPDSAQRTAAIMAQRGDGAGAAPSK